MDLNTATYDELITLANIGDVRSTTIVTVRERERIGRNLTLLDLTLDCSISGDVKDWMECGAIQSVPRHEDGKSEQAAILLMSISASIQELFEAVDRVNNRQTLHESVLTSAGVNVPCASDAHTINQTDTKESMGIPRQDSSQDQKIKSQSRTISRQDFVQNADETEVARTPPKSFKRRCRRRQ